MNRKRDIIIKEFINQFNLEEVNINVDDKNHMVRAVSPLKNNLPYDVSLNYGNKIIAIIEFIYPKNFDFFENSNIERYAEKNKIGFYIVSDGKRFVITDRRNSTRKHVHDLYGLIQIFKERKNVNNNEIKVQIFSVISSIIHKSPFNKLKILLESTKINFENLIDCDELTQIYSFKYGNDFHGIENQIFQLLLDDEVLPKQVFRYTSISKLLGMLKNNTFGMNCIAGMNDTTEINYVENYFSEITRDYNQFSWKTVDSYNRRFISSCTLRKDDLTHWRLYAEDSKGVCLAFTVKENRINSKFILKKISYAKKEQEHPELDLIKNIIITLREKLNIDFEFKTLNTWRHFFKPHDYAIEKEVRLLHIQNKDEIKKEWIITNSHGILNSFIEFKLNNVNLPLLLTEIILGPNCPEKELNLKQLEQLIRELKRKKISHFSNNENIDIFEYQLFNLKVSLSKIKNYR